MVREFKFKTRIVYQCEFCDMGYISVANAERCEEYCSTHDACSLEITRNAKNRPGVNLMPH